MGLKFCSHCRVEWSALYRAGTWLIDRTHCPKCHSPLILRKTTDEEAQGATIATPVDPQHG